MRNTLIAIVLLLLSVLVLAARTLGGPILELSAAIAFVGLCIIGLASSTIREVLLLIAAVVLGVLLLRDGSGAAALLQGLNLAAYFAAFIALLTALKLASERSTSVLNVGRFLIRQPASGRFVATASGGHVLGVFLNFGAISLMAPLIQNAAKYDDGTVDQDMERRQLSALLRGFAWILLWAPTTLTQAVLLTLFTNIDLSKIITLGIATSVIMMVLGLIFDRAEWRGSQTQAAAPPFPTTALLRLALICGTLVICTATLQIGAELSTAVSLMFVAPVVTLFWFAAQARSTSTIPAHLATFWPALTSDVTGLARSAIALGLSGFIGRTLADVLPVATMAAKVDLTAVPGWLFLAALPVLITLGGQIALSPIILVVFIGQVVQAFPILPADPTHIVFALSGGWAISMFMSPNATATLLISATTRIPPTRLTWEWNAKYGATCYAVLVVIFALLER